MALNVCVAETPGSVASPMHGLLGLFANVFFLLGKGKIVLS
jgi:hypothetical protein